jgi:hypothetical protein
MWLIYFCHDADFFHILTFFLGTFCHGDVLFRRRYVNWYVLLRRRFVCAPFFQRLFSLFSPTLYLFELKFCLQNKVKLMYCILQYTLALPWRRITTVSSLVSCGIWKRSSFSSSSVQSSADRAQSWCTWSRGEMNQAPSLSSAFCKIKFVWNHVF